jgi:L-alanine-DL-glutamate epimerase-like enolase superfamily enzyme
MSTPCIKSVEVNLRHMPLKAPFVTARGRTDTARSQVVEIRCTDGTLGLGAVTPAPYVTGETIDDVDASIRAMTAVLVGAPLDEHEALFDRLTRDFPKAHAARAGVEIAVMDAWGQSVGKPLWRLWGGATPVVETDLTVPLNSLQEARDVAKQAAADGLGALKIKVDGAKPKEMLERIREVHANAPAAVLLIDANQSFTVNSALAFLDILERENLPIDLFEQPVDAKDLEGLVRIARESALPIGADEAVVTPEDCRRLLDAGGTQVVNVKLMKSGIHGGLQIIGMCREAGVTLMLGCMVECRIGIGAAVHLTCGTGAFRFHDLDGPLLLKEDIAEGSFELDGNRMSACDLPGLGARLIPV